MNKIESFYFLILIYIMVHNKLELAGLILIGVLCTSIITVGVIDWYYFNCEECEVCEDCDQINAEWESTDFQFSIDPDAQLTNYIDGLHTWQNFRSSNISVPMPYSGVGEIAFIGFEVLGDMETTIVNLDFTSDGEYTARIALWNGTYNETTELYEPDSEIEYSQDVNITSIEISTIDVSTTEDNIFFVSLTLVGIGESDQLNLNCVSNATDAFSYHGHTSMPGVYFTELSEMGAPYDGTLDLVYNASGYLADGIYYERESTNDWNMSYFNIGASFTEWNQTEALNQQISIGGIDNNLESIGSVADVQIQKGLNYSYSIFTNEEFEFGNSLQCMVSLDDYFSILAAPLIGIFDLLAGNTENLPNWLNGPYTNGTITLDPFETHEIVLKEINTYRNITLAEINDPPALQVDIVLEINGIEYTFVMQIFDISRLDVFVDNI